MKPKVVIDNSIKDNKLSSTTVVSEVESKSIFKTITINTIFNKKVLIEDSWYLVNSYIHKRFKIINITIDSVWLFDIISSKKYTLNIYKNRKLIYEVFN